MALTKRSLPVFVYLARILVSAVWWAWLADTDDRQVPGLVLQVQAGAHPAVVAGDSAAVVKLPLVERVLLAERLGYDSAWTWEMNGADAASPLAYLAALTKRIRLGTAVMPLAARTPANCAMVAGTIDALAGHADVNSTDCCTLRGTRPRGISTNPNFGK